MNATGMVLVGAFGFVIGSFLNVVIHRVPRGQPVIGPPGERGLRTRPNFPMVSRLVLGGTRADGTEPIGVRYVLVEAGTAVLFVAVTARLAELHLLGALPAYLYFTAIGIALSMIDIDCQRLPDRIVLPSYPAVAVLLTVAAVTTDDGNALVRAAVGGTVLFVFYFALALASPAGMGFGDVKLSGLVGAVLAYLSWSALIVGAFAGFVFGAVAGIGVIALRRGNRKTALPFGPFMLAGALTAIFAGGPLVQFYAG
jgi:leader peptidase (prepilin peptidase) / N-methyltransferase